MEVRDIMSKEVIKVESTMPLLKLIELFKSFHTFPLVPVVDAENKLIGKVSFKNLLEQFQPYKKDTRRIIRAVPFLEKKEPLNIFQVEIIPEITLLLVVEDFMDNKVFSAREDASLEDAYKIMKKSSQDYVPVVDKDNRLTGMLGIFDIMRALFKEKGII